MCWILGVIECANSFTTTFFNNPVCCDLLGESEIPSQFKTVKKSFNPLKILCTA